AGGDDRQPHEGGIAETYLQTGHSAVPGFTAEYLIRTARKRFELVGHEATFIDPAAASRAEVDLIQGDDVRAAVDGGRGDRTRDFAQVALYLGSVTEEAATT